MIHIIFTETFGEIKKRNKIFRIIVSMLFFAQTNDIICVLGGVNHGKTYYKNREHNNRKF